jgi:ADP-ribose pyrophosphatase YjhB (NUDIX family)
MDPKWLSWAKQLQTMAQTGLTYTNDPYDSERYKRIQEIAYEIMATQTESELAPVKGLFAYEEGHATPKVDVRAVAFREGKILLVKERSDGGWTVPGGWADVGESASEGVVREVREESGYEVRATRILAIYDRGKHPHPPHPQYIYKIFFACEIVGGTASLSSETDGVDFFGEENIPPLSRSRVLPEQIQRFFEMNRDPTLAPDFD